MSPVSYILQPLAMRSVLFSVVLIGPVFGQQDANPHSPLVQAISELQTLVSEAYGQYCFESTRSQFWFLDLWGPRTWICGAARRPNYLADVPFFGFGLAGKGAAWRCTAARSSAQLSSSVRPARSGRA